MSFAKQGQKQIGFDIVSDKFTKADAGITADEPTETAKTISVSQQSFDSLIEKFAKLIELVSSEPKEINHRSQTVFYRPH